MSNLPFIIVDDTDESTEARMIRMASMGIRSAVVETRSQEQMSKMMATGGISQVTTEQPQPAQGPASGVIGGEDATPTETVADDIPMDVPEGSFIINAAAAEVAGYKDIKKMIMDAVGVAKRLGVDISTGNDKIGDEEAVDLLVSKGEVYIEPTLAKIIGYDVLEKINNRGKREVARRQEEAEQQQQAPQPQQVREGGFVKKKFADGGEPLLSDVNPDYEYYEDSDAVIPSKYELLKEINPTSEQDTQMGDIEFQMDMLRRSGDDPVMREAFNDAASRLPSEYIELRNMSIGELYRQSARQAANDLYFKRKKITPESLDPSIPYYIKEKMEARQEQGLDDSGIPSLDYYGAFNKEYHTIESSAHTQKGNPTRVSATLFHELLHKGHQNLVGIPSLFDKKGKANRQAFEKGQILHLDVHRRTYEAYKDEMPREMLIEFIEDAEVSYGSDRTRAKMRDVITEAGAPKPSGGIFRDYSKVSSSELKRIADITFDAVAKLPEMKSLDKELKAAADQRQKLRFRDSSGFIPKN